MNSMNDKMMAKVSGVMVGIVTDNKDPENMSRVKVKLPVHDDATATDWIRIATLMGGKDRGTLFIPEVNDEVLVAFHMGDIREPFVIGMLWNKKMPPPAGKDDKNNIRKIVSRQGHEITFDDKEQDGKLTLKTKDGHLLEFLDKNDTVTLKEKSGQNMLTIKGSPSNEIEIKSGTSKITLNNKGDVTIESAKSLKVKSTQLNLEASATMSIKAGASLDVKCDGLVNIKGAMVKIN
jgi:uncharacterized protein involved in type VI secretion and phage assembly